MASRRNITLEPVEVTHINGSELPQPVRGRSVLQLRPRFRFTLEFDGFFAQALPRGDGPCRIKTATGIEADVVFNYSLNDVFTSPASVKVSAILSESPYTVMRPETQIGRADFSLVNFCRIFGGKARHVTRNRTSYFLGSIEIEYRDFILSITECLDFSKEQARLRAIDGYGITHTGVLRRGDKVTYSVADAQEFLRKLRVFLSFLRGAGCGVAPVWAVVAGRRRTLLRWGAQYTVSARQGNDSWLAIPGGGDVVSCLLPDFFDLCDDWGDSLFSVVDWYLQANSSAAHVALVLAQASLETLAQQLVGSMPVGDALRRLTPQELGINKNQPRRGKSVIGDVATVEGLLRLTLRELDIDTRIPKNCLGLQGLSRQHISAARKQRHIGDGPEALVQLRNDLVHSQPKYPRPSGTVQLNAMYLSRRYIEAILLKKLGFTGRYFDRVSEKVICLDDLKR